MKQTKTIKLTVEQIELLIEVLNTAQIEKDFASQKRHVLFLPDLFKTLKNYKDDLASLKDLFILSLK